MVCKLLFFIICNNLLENKTKQIKKQKPSDSFTVCCKLDDFWKTVSRGSQLKAANLACSETRLCTLLWHFISQLPLMRKLLVLLHENMMHRYQSLATKDSFTSTSDSGVLSNPLCSFLPWKELALSCVYHSMHLPK